MKLVLSFLPLILFFAAYKFYDIYIATTVAIGTAVVLILLTWIKDRKLEKIQLANLLLLLVLGGATLLFKNPLFIKWKPTAINWLFAAVFLGSQYLGGKPMLQRLMGQAMSAPRAVWMRMNLAWVAFFLSVGFLNLYVAYNFDEATWVNFKLFGVLGITLLFIVGQSFFLMRYAESTDSSEK